MKKLLILLFPTFLQAQDVALGGWKDYSAYKSATYIAENNNNIYCVSNGGLFFIKKSDQSINRLSKITGLSDVGVQLVACVDTLDITLIIYENCNIDILKNNQVINVSDIKRKEIGGLKKINNITIKNNVAYLSSSLGLILLDIITNEVKDTYNIGIGENIYMINGSTFNGDSIIVATSGGMFYADINSQNLNDYRNWSPLMGYENEETYDNVIFEDNIINGDFQNEIISISFNNNTLIRTKFDRLELKKDGYDFELKHFKFQQIKYAWADNQNNIWVADSINGILKFTNYEYQETYMPKGPTRNEIYSLEYEENKLYVCHGGHQNFGANAYINEGASIKNNFDEWVNYNSTTLGNSRDILEVAVMNGKEYFASWYNGIIEMENGELVKKYGFTNTNEALDTCYYSNNRIRISDIKFDSYGNMWALSSEVNHPIVVKTINNDWYSYSINQNQVDLFLDDLLIDSYNQKWGVLGRGRGLFVYSDNNTIDITSDDQYKILNTNIGTGNLPSLQTYSIIEDLNNQIWVGTDQGIAVFYNPGDIFSEFNFDSQQILITEGNYGQYLLSEEKIKCITIDGANRKWIGTEKSGVFLVSEDGQEAKLHFTIKNSPLPSNNIIDIAINHKNGEVFIGTEKGLISYRSDATSGVKNQSKTNVFPNPVKESYSGPIAINGLVYDANVKITDISGNLVFETNANGGQAVWDGKNKSGERAGTGVYLVFSTDIYGNENMVSKILFIH